MLVVPEIIRWSFLIYVRVYSVATNFWIKCTTLCDKPTGAHIQCLADLKASFSLWPVMFNGNKILQQCFIFFHNFYQKKPWGPLKKTDLVTFLIHLQTKCHDNFSSNFWSEDVRIKKAAFWRGLSPCLKLINSQLIYVCTFVVFLLVSTPSLPSLGLKFSIKNVFLKI